MIATTINGRACNTISDFYALSVPKIKYDSGNKVIRTVKDYYDFLINEKYLLKKDVVEAWHKLLIWYSEQPDVPFFVRKYEAGKNDDGWDNRRGCVIKYKDGFEIVYSSNFLAHDIFLMAYHGFVPDEADFMAAAKNRLLHITSGTEIEKKIRLYPSANKGLKYCYLAHIMDVNGSYLRDDGTYRKISGAETNRIFPRGTENDWTKSSDKILHIDRELSDSEKELVKAHFLRFLDPMNYFLTPLTGHCSHTIPGFSRNIGEFPLLTYYVGQQYKNIYKASYDELIEKGKYSEQEPKGYSEKAIINLKSSEKNVGAPEDVVASDADNKEIPSVTQKRQSDIEEFINDLGDFMRPAHAESTVGCYLRIIKDLLESQYSLNDLCRGIDRIIENHSKGGKDFKEGNHNTVSALKQVRKMVQYPYICYDAGYESFVGLNIRLAGYCIDGYEITFSKVCDFVPASHEFRKISGKDMKVLLDILKEADANNLFQDSYGCLNFAHGKKECYDYRFGKNTGVSCCSLFKEGKQSAPDLSDRFEKLIEKLTK